MLRPVFNDLEPHQCPLKRRLSTDEIELLLAPLFGQPLLRPLQRGTRPLNIDVSAPFGRLG
jgi:hypothetical protein